MGMGRAGSRIGESLAKLGPIKRKSSEILCLVISIIVNDQYASKFPGIFNHATWCVYSEAVLAVDWFGQETPWCPIEANLGDCTT